ncbi:hypothetical protein N7474_007880 [Penicillium riverlandense]|uniref:uncharacterized protein n=1 Tax=Penicillium riverlandense TaxID=1903569 RepID=UPI002548A089|nr:uncharacterized protein N7474_007880 [Penicillium riverlandense]KAJ5811579.1 hypothetical protein N7474_007880 [Penicillium riverlandense]
MPEHLFGQGQGEARNLVQVHILHLTREVGQGVMGIGIKLCETHAYWYSPTNDFSFSNSRYCVVFAEKPAFDKVAKAWVPEFDSCDNKVWFNMDEEVIDDAIESVGAPQPGKTIRLSTVFGRQYQHIKQVVVPPELMGSKPPRKGPLGITAHCYDSLDKLPTYVADINNWPNTFGTPQ